MPATRTAITHKFRVGDHKGYLNVGFLDDGSPGEIFVTMSREGSTIGGLVDSIATLTSIALQSGVPLESLCRKFAFQRFEPCGFTPHPNIPYAHSIVDYIFRWLGHQFVPEFAALESRERRSIISTDALQWSGKATPSVEGNEPPPNLPSDSIAPDLREGHAGEQGMVGGGA